MAGWRCRLGGGAVRAAPPAPPLGAERFVARGGLPDLDAASLADTAAAEAAGTLCLLDSGAFLNVGAPRLASTAATSSTDDAE